MVKASGTTGTPSTPSSTRCTRRTISFSEIFSEVKWEGSVTPIYSRIQNGFVAAMVGSDGSSKTSQLKLQSDVPSLNP